MGVMITLSNGLAHPMGKLALIGVSAVSTGLVAGTLWLALPIKRLLGNTGINIATRLMALIVAATGVDFILTGLKNQLPALAH